jgi:CBS domain-containing protein
MNVSEILDRKGNQVVTVAPNDSVRSVVATLAEKGFGALVVSADGSTIDGIVSERDIVRQLGRDGEIVLDQSVAEIMTTPVMTCAPGDDVQGLMLRMTEHRIRHLPAERDGSLAGMISIGDVVKWRVTELERDMGHLESYIKQGW